MNEFREALGIVAQPVMPNAVAAKRKEKVSLEKIGVMEIKETLSPGKLSENATRCKRSLAVCLRPGRRKRVFSDPRRRYGWIMKHFLRFFVVAMACTQWTLAQEVPAVDSAFGNGEGVNGEVFAMAIQADGKIVIGGQFTAVNGVPRQNVARLNADGSLDTTWSSQYTYGANGPIYAIALAPSGGILIGGNFTMAGNGTRTDLALLDADKGMADPSFAQGAGGDLGTDGTVRAILVQPDGKIVIGGEFNFVHGQSRRNIARLNADGSNDTPLTGRNMLNGRIDALAQLPGDSVLAGGSFSAAHQKARSLTTVP